MDEKSIFEIDWSTIPDKQRRDIIVKYLSFDTAVKKSAYTQALYTSNVVVLISMMSLSTLLRILQFENKQIIISLILLQFFIVFTSKIVEFGMRSKSEYDKSELKKMLEEIR